MEKNITGAISYWAHTYTCCKLFCHSNSFQQLGRGQWQFPRNRVLTQQEVRMPRMILLLVPILYLWDESKTKNMLDVWNLLLHRTIFSTPCNNCILLVVALSEPVYKRKNFGPNYLVLAISHLLPCRHLGGVHYHCWPNGSSRKVTVVIMRY